MLPQVLYFSRYLPSGQFVKVAIPLGAIGPVDSVEIAPVDATVELDEQVEETGRLGVCSCVAGSKLGYPSFECMRKLKA